MTGSVTKLTWPHLKFPKFAIRMPVCFGLWQDKNKHFRWHLTNFQYYQKNPWKLKHMQHQKQPPTDVAIQWFAWNIIKSIWCSSYLNSTWKCTMLKMISPPVFICIWFYTFTFNPGFDIYHKAVFSCLVAQVLTLLFKWKGCKFEVFSKNNERVKNVKATSTESNCYSLDEALTELHMHD